MKITFEKTEADARLYAEMTRALSNATLRTIAHIDKTAHKRSIPDPVKALEVQRLRNEHNVLCELREQLQLAWRLSKKYEKPAMTFEECMSDPHCGAWPKCGCPSTNECVRNK